MIKETRIRPIARRVLAAQSDDRLVQLFREGHDPAFEEIVSRYRKPLTAFAAAIVPHDRAEDVVQASLVRAHRALRADEREISLRAWLFTIVRNGALNVIRDDPNWQELDPSYNSVPQPAEIAEQNEELQALVTAICALPDDQREALVARELRGDGHAEIASRLGTTATAVRGLIFRARTTLRNGLGAVVPLPVLRLMMSEGASGAAGAGVAGAGAVGFGGGAKLAATISAGALALGGGLALKPDESGNRAPAEAEAAQPAEGTAAGTTRLQATGSGAGSSPGAVSVHSGRSGPGGKDSASSGPDGGSGGNEGSGGSGRGGDGHGGGNSGPGGGGKGGGPGPSSDDDGSVHEDDDSAGSEPDDDHSGKGGGDDPFGESGSDDDSSGHEEEDAAESESDDDHSGKGGGDRSAYEGDSLDD